MAKKAGIAETAKSAKKPSAIPATPVSSTPVRNSPIPKPPAATPAARPTLTYEAIAKKAYEIYASGSGGSEHDNWLRAEYELRKEMGL